MRTAVIGFLAGALSVLVFHQLGFFIATELGFLKVQIYNMKPLPPLGVPTIASLAFWGGLWGIAAAFIVPRLPGALGGPLGWVLFAGVVVMLVNWFVVPIVYAFWGFGMWLFASALRRTLKWN